MYDNSRITCVSLITPDRVGFVTQYVKPCHFLKLDKMKILIRLLRILALPLFIVIAWVFIVVIVVTPIYWIITGKWKDLFILLNKVYEALEKFCFGDNYKYTEDFPM